MKKLEAEKHEAFLPIKKNHEEAKLAKEEYDPKKLADVPRFRNLDYEHFKYFSAHHFVLSTNFQTFQNLLCIVCLKNM